MSGKKKPTDIFLMRYKNSYKKVYFSLLNYKKPRPQKGKRKHSAKLPWAVDFLPQLKRK